MKNLLTVLFLVLAIQYCQAQNKSFHITGSIQGPCEGMVFKLLDNSYPPQTIATTVIKDHCFELTGEIPAPGFYRWIIDTTPVGKKSSEANWLAGNFYLENSDITFQGDIHTLPTYYWNPERKGKMIIQGSETEDLYQSFKTSIQELSKARNQADGEYLEQYHRPALDNIFNTEEGIRLARRISELDRQIIQATIRFIKQNPASVVARSSRLFPARRDRLNLRSDRRSAKYTFRGLGKLSPYDRIQGKSRDGQKNRYRSPVSRHRTHRSGREKSKIIRMPSNRKICDARILGILVRPLPG